MNDLLEAAASAWEQVAHGNSSIIVATLVTNIVYTAFEGVENRLKLSSSVSDPATLWDKFNELAQGMGFTNSEDDSSKSLVQQLLESLQVSWQQLLEIKGEGPAKQREKVSPSFKQIEQLVLRRGVDSGTTDDECLMVLLQNTIQHIRSGYLDNSILRLGTPVYLEVMSFLAHDGAKIDGLHGSYGLHMLLQLYKSYHFAVARTDRLMNCRLQALKFAQEALPSIDAVLDNSTMPCRCQGTLAYHLQFLGEDLKGFLSVYKFDFYFQSPWVCGCHMLEMSEALFYYGLRLFSYRNYVGSVVHVYNVLRRFTDLEPIPLLENLCTAFCNVFFPGGRPDRNFKACYFRFMGGRLRFNSHASDHKSDCYSMAIPAHTARATAGFDARKQIVDSRFEYRKISCFYHIKERGYRLDDATWNRICRLSSNDDEDGERKDHKRRSCTHHGHPADAAFSSCSAQHRLASLQKAVLTEFTAPFPVAKVNFLRVYLACVHIIAKISDRYHGDGERAGQHCLCFVDPILSTGDRCRSCGCGFRPVGCKDLVRICREAMQETLGGILVDEFVWNYI